MPRDCGRGALVLSAAGAGEHLQLFWGAAGWSRTPPGAGLGLTPRSPGASRAGAAPAAPCEPAAAARPRPLPFLGRRRRKRRLRRGRNGAGRSGSGTAPTGRGTPAVPPRRYLAGSAGPARAGVLGPRVGPGPQPRSRPLWSQNGRALPHPAPAGSPRSRDHFFCHPPVQGSPLPPPPQPPLPTGVQSAHDTMRQAKGSCERVSSAVPVPARPEPCPHVLPGGGTGW